MKLTILLLVLWAIPTLSFAAEVSVEGCASAMVITSTATIADFESLSGSGLVRRSAPYLEDGFSLTTEWENTGMSPGEDKFSSVHDGSEFYSGTVSFITHFSDDFPILMRQGGGSFDLLSIDLDSLFLGNAQVEFTGTKTVGGTVVQSFNTDANSNSMETFAFSGFDDLVSVSWVNLENSTLHHYDNIVVEMPGAISGFPEECTSVEMSLETDLNGAYKSVSEDLPLYLAWGGCNSTGVDVNFTIENSWRYLINTHTEEGERASGHMSYAGSPTYRDEGSDSFTKVYSDLIPNSACIDAFTTLLVGYDIATGLDPNSLKRDEDVRGLFFDVDNPGHGFDFNSLEAGFQLFYYGHTPDGQRLWLISDPITENIEYGRTVELELFEVPDGVFGLPDKSSTVSWGTISVTFNDCNSAHVFMTGADGVLQMNLVRLAGETNSDCL
jgi:hypothetical protein